MQVFYIFPVRILIILFCFAFCTLEMAQANGNHTDFPITYEKNKQSLQLTQKTLPFENAINHIANESNSMSLLEAPEIPSITHHFLYSQNELIAYTAVAGELITRNLKQSTPEASIFYVAYTADDYQKKDRPVMFVTDGGPGFSTAELHLNSFGPKKIEEIKNGSNKHKTFQLVDNSNTLLNIIDLVFIDPVGTGYSKAISPRKNGDFWNIDKDAEIYRDFIVRYLKLNNRANSPVYLYGNSYGGARNAVASNLLIDSGVMLTGVILSSPILNFGSTCPILDVINGGGTDIKKSKSKSYISCAGFMPSYAATSIFYGIIPKPTKTETYLYEKVIPYIENTYLPQWMKYTQAKKSKEKTKEKTKKSKSNIEFPENIITTMSNFGIDLSSDPGDFNPKPNDLYGKWRPECTMESEDSRKCFFHETEDEEPDLLVLTTKYLAETLNVNTTRNYVIDNQSQAFKKWDFKQNRGHYADTIPYLDLAIKKNTNMKVFVASGIYDLSTPFYQTEIEINRLSKKSKITSKLYDSGHGIFPDSSAASLYVSDLIDFFKLTY